MRDSYALSPMRAGQLVQAFAFLRTFSPEVTIERWEVVANKSYRMIVVTDIAGYIRGLTVSSVRTHPIARKLLDVPIFIVGSIADENAIAESLFREVRRRAIVQQCDFMRIWTWSSDVLDRLDDFAYCERWDHGLMLGLKPASVQPVERH